MAHVSAPPLPMAGDYLVVTFADLMHSTRFRKHVWAKMPLTERRRLESLRLQALYGDAPEGAVAAASHDDAENDSPEDAAPATEAASASAKPSSSSSSGEKAVLKDTAASSPPSSSSASRARSQQPSPPRWFDIAGRARYAAWVALRGRMSPDVAAECFCAEFLGCIKKYPHPALLPPVEAALSTANGLAQRARSGRQGPRQAKSTASSTPSANTTAPTPVLQVRALQGDPAALALLWICRAYRIPCEFIVEPLSKAMGAAPRASALPVEAAAAAGEASAAANPYLPYTMADACYPFSVSLLHSSASAAMQLQTAATVTTPEAAFVLLADTFLAAYPHWMGVPADRLATSAPSAASGNSSSAGATADTTAQALQRMVQRSGWVEELQRITRHVRTPILALLVHQATAAQQRSGAGVSAARQDLLRAVAAHLHTYEQWTMGQVLNRRVHQAQFVLSPVLASTAVVDALQHAYAPDVKAVTAADVFVASCGYALCTHPFCADVFPLLHVPPVEATSSRRGGAVQAQWPASERPPAASLSSPAAASLTRAGAEEGTTLPNTASYASWALPLYLSGVPAEYNELVNRLLRREAQSATQHAQRQQPVRLFISDAEPSSSSGSGSNSTVVAAPSISRAEHYEVSCASVTKEAAEAVQQLMLARLSSLRSDDLRKDSVVGSTSSVSGAPFLVLGHLFALTWALAQEQVPAFPYFMVDGNPSHLGGFSFLPETSVSAKEQKSTSGSGVSATAAAAVRARPRFQVALAPAPAVATPSSTHASGAVMLPAEVEGSFPIASASSRDGGASLESQLRAGWQAVSKVVAKGVARLAGRQHDSDGTSDNKGSVHATRVLRSEGGEGATVAAVQGSDDGAAGGGASPAGASGASRL